MENGKDYRIDLELGKICYFDEISNSFSSETTYIDGVNQFI